MYLKFFVPFLIFSFNVEKHACGICQILAISMEHDKKCLFFCVCTCGLGAKYLPNYMLKHHGGPKFLVDLNDGASFKEKNRCLPNEYFEHENPDSNKYYEFGFGGVEIHLKLLINRSSFNANNSELNFIFINVHTEIHGFRDTGYHGTVYAIGWSSRHPCSSCSPWGHLKVS